MNQEQLVKGAVDASTQAVWDHDKHLLATDASERSLTHQLAIYLSHHFTNYQVDCEYNRDGFSVKRLALHERTGIQDDSVDAVTVFPDVIVHRRGHNDHNLLVVELKKASSYISDDYDLLKLNAFKRDLGYQFACHLRIGYSLDGAAVTKIQWI